MSKMASDVVLSGQLSSQVWREFFEMMQNIDVPEEFMVKRPMNVPPHNCHLFEEEP
jgi:hypothetical protein